MLVVPPSSAPAAEHGFCREKLDLANFSGRALVLLFVSVECPISNSYVPELRRLAEKFEKHGITFRLVYPNVNETESAIRKHMRAYNLHFVALGDPDHDLVRAAKVYVTPEAAVYMPGNGWVYRGRIDDRYVSFGKARVRCGRKFGRKKNEAAKQTQGTG